MKIVVSDISNFGSACSNNCITAKNCSNFLVHSLLSFPSFLAKALKHG